jgi:hypothetical protein
VSNRGGSVFCPGLAWLGSLFKTEKQKNFFYRTLFDRLFFFQQNALHRSILFDLL